MREDTEKSEKACEEYVKRAEPIRDGREAALINFFRSYLAHNCTLYDMLRAAWIDNASEIADALRRAEAEEYHWNRPEADGVEGVDGIPD